MRAGRRRFRPEEVTQEYLQREVDSRMVEIIGRHLAGHSTVLDVACGSGLYGPHLREVVPVVYGIDHDEALCAAALATGAYERVANDRVERTTAHFDEVDAVFCSEFLEHVPNERLRGTLDVLERVVRRRLVVTVPNPLSPHFAHDPTHVARYNIFSMRARLNQSDRFTYRLHPLGLSDPFRQKAWGRWADQVCSRSALLSPTVLYLGDRKP